MRTVVTLVSTLLCGLASAQYVSPAHHARAEGLSNNVFPFGNTTVPFRFSQLHDDIPAMTVTSMTFRHNLATVTYASHSVTCDGWMSTALTASGSASTTFDNNHGTDKLQVIVNRTYNHPASDPRCAPGDWLLSYPLDVPFTFAGSPGTLCWEVQVTAKTQTSSVTHDAFSTSTNPSLQVGRGGVGCIATGRTTAMSATGTSTMTWASGTGTLTFNGTNGPANAAAFHVLGTDKNSWFGLPLPFELPGTNSAPSGSCYIYTDVLTSFPVVASATGALTNAVPVPATQNLHGLATLSQYWCLDSAANSWGIVTSPVVPHAWVAPPPAAVACRVYLSGSLGLTGTFSTSSWLITQFN
ncbi:MAG: hypothetical protein R3F56_07150 [Planctomycetota bacterium]